jgi:CheY-like chemotaxis protein
MPSYEIPSRVTIEDGFGKKHSGEIHGFIETGLWVSWSSPALLPFRSEVRLTFETAVRPHLAADAEVVYSSADGVGFEIADRGFLPIVRAWASGVAAEVTDDIASRDLPRLATRDVEGVLIVEDEAAIALMLQAAFVKAGYECALARDVEAARAILEKRKIGVILLDWMLPKVSGQVLLEEVRRTRPSIRVAVISGVVSHRSTRQEVLALGAAAVFSKPFSLVEVLRWVKG